MDVDSFLKEVSRCTVLNRRWCLYFNREIFELGGHRVLSLKVLKKSSNELVKINIPEYLPG